MSAPHLTPEEFREQGHRVVDWIADYWASVDDLPVLAQVRPGGGGRAPDQRPRAARDARRGAGRHGRHLIRGLTHWQHPRFFAYFPANSSPAGVLGDLLSSGIGTQGMLWATSPAATELEQVVLDWLRRALALPDVFGRGRRRGRHPGHRVDRDVHRSARRAAPGDRGDGPPRRRTRGRFAIYGSTQAHSSLLKAAMMSGLGERAVRSVAVDPKTQAMDVAALREAMAADVAAGVRPVFVQLAVGTTSTGARPDRSDR